MIIRIVHRSLYVTIKKPMIMRRTNISANSELLDKIRVLENCDSNEELIDKALGYYYQRLNRDKPKSIPIGSTKAKKLRKIMSDQLNIIKFDIIALYGARDIFIQIVDIAGNNQSFRDNPFFEWILINYSVRAVITIRRILHDSSDDSISLATLISEMIRHTNIFTRNDYVRRWMGKSTGIHARMRRKTANDEFDSYAGKNDIIDPGILIDRLRNAQSKGNSVKAFANTAIAHRSIEVKNSTFDDLNRAIDSTGELFNFINVLLHGGSVMLTPIRVGNWKSIFTEPIFKKNKAYQ